MIGRRGFIVSLAAAMAFDPDKALWIPGRVHHSVPSGKVFGEIPPGYISMSDVLNKLAAHAQFTWRCTPDNKIEFSRDVFLYSEPDRSIRKSKSFTVGDVIRALSPVAVIGVE